MSFNRVCAEIDLDILKNNFLKIKDLANQNSKKEIKLFPSVKANAYGHGAVVCGKNLVDLGCNMLCVAAISEALELRTAGIDIGILLLAPINPNSQEEIDAIINNNVCITVYDIKSLEKLDTYASLINKKVSCQIKIDTGMGRIGINTHDFADFFKKAISFKNINIIGVYSHLANADSGITEDDFTYHQIELFQQNIISEKEILPNNHLINHISNSAGLLNYPKARFDAARPGIILYGYYQNQQILTDIGIKPFLKLKSRIIHLKEMNKGYSIGYNRTYTLNKKSKIATVSIGYADGYPRILSNKAAMIVNGFSAPVIGRICMDQCMIDVTDIPNVERWQEVSVYDDAYEVTSISNLSKLSNTISYELLTSISPRVERHIIKNIKT